MKQHLSQIMMIVCITIFILIGCKDVSDDMNENINVEVKGVTFTMIKVNGDTFYMGAQNDNPNGYNYDEEAEAFETPVHQVTLSDYYIGETEVTQELWLAIMGKWPDSSFENQPNTAHGLGNDFPVYYINWNDCQNFILALNKITGRTFRLPTEAEWEYAARGGDMSNGYKYSGSNNIDDVAWYIFNSNITAHPVGQKSVNELEIYDMSGNVEEWCQDWYDDYNDNNQINPTGPSCGSCRILRGGSWLFDKNICRTSHRGILSPHFRFSEIGFRLVLVQ